MLTLFIVRQFILRTTFELTLVNKKVFFKNLFLSFLLNSKLIKIIIL